MLQIKADYPFNKHPQIINSQLLEAMVPYGDYTHLLCRDVDTNPTSLSSYSGNVLIVWECVSVWMCVWVCVCVCVESQREKWVWDTRA